MILHVSFEELSALRSGAEVVLSEDTAPRGGVMAPSETRAKVEALLPRLTGDLGVSTLLELNALRGAVAAIVERLRERMEERVLLAHPADEDAVTAYFEFAHGLSVLGRIDRMASQMRAVIELVTGAPVTPQAERSFRFDDEEE